MQETAKSACDESFWTTQGKEQTIIQREVDGIKKRQYLTILLITYSILLIAFTQFIPIWWAPGAWVYIATYFCFSVIVYVIIGSLWVRFVKPQVHVHVIGKAGAASSSSFLTEVFDLQEPQNSVETTIRKQNRENYRVQPRLLFVLVFISIGLTVSSILSWFNNLPCFTSSYYDYSNTLQYNLIPVGPIILIAVLAVAAFVLYPYFRNQMRSALVAFLALPTVLSSVVVLLQYNLHSDYFSQLVAPSASLIDVFYDYAYILSHAFLLGVFILLLAVICQFFINLRKFYTCISDDRETGIDKLVALLPQRVRVGSSHALFFCTRLSGCSEKSVDHFELKLQARGIKFDGSKRATMCDRSHITTLAWNCCFPASGVQTINIFLNAISGSREHPILIDKHEVTVDNLFTATWLPILVAVIPILAAVIAALVH